jgi:hypothetical protein
MRLRTWAAASAVTSALLAGTASGSAAAAEPVPWSVQHQTATASGQRWIEPNGMILWRDLVITGKFSNTGDGCYSLWTQFVHDLAPGPALKRAEVCGTAPVDLNLRQPIQLTTGVYVTVCKGTKDTSDCAAWVRL